MGAHIDDVYFTPEEVAARHRTEAATLANHRHKGSGLPWVKLPSGKVLYRLADVLEAERVGEKGWRENRVIAAIETFRKIDPKTAAELIAHIKSEIGR